MEDREISKQRWNMYLKKYKDKYKVKRDELGTWCIACRYNNIILPYSIVNGQLVAVCEYKNGKGLTALRKRLDNNGLKDYDITQEGDNDICIMFNENAIDKYVIPLRIRKKKVLSEETKERLRKQLAEARRSKK